MSDLILTISGASGSGKTSVARELLSRIPELCLISSTTTRDPRESDLPGEYHYITETAFEILRKAEVHLWAEEDVHGAKFMTIRKEVRLAVPNSDTRKRNLMILVPWRVSSLKEGLRKLSPQTQQRSVYLTVSPILLDERLRKRGETFAGRKRRLKDCLDWAKNARDSDFPFAFLSNDGPLSKTVDHVIDVLGK